MYREVYPLDTKKAHRQLDRLLTEVVKKDPLVGPTAIREVRQRFAEGKIDGGRYNSAPDAGYPYCCLIGSLGEELNEHGSDSLAYDSWPDVSTGTIESYLYPVETHVGYEHTAAERRILGTITRWIDQWLERNGFVEV